MPAGQLFGWSATSPPSCSSRPKEKPLWIEFDEKYDGDGEWPRDACLMSSSGIADDFIGDDEVQLNPHSIPTKRLCRVRGD